MGLFNFLRGGIGPPFDPSTYASRQTHKLRARELAVTSPYGPRHVTSNPAASTYHTAVDLRAATGTPVVAPKDGLVARAGAIDSTCGTGVILDHAGRWKTGYCHMSQVAVAPGQPVARGQVIGYTGGGASDPGRGASTGPHLHFIVYDKENGDAQVDPLQVAEFAPFVVSYADTGKDPLGAEGYQVRYRRAQLASGLKIAGSLAAVGLLMFLLFRIRTKRRESRWEAIAQGGP